MNEFYKNVQVRWSDLDPNFHVRHSVYYDWGAFCRIEFLNEYGLSTNLMASLQFGPILFREECTFRKEIRLGDQVDIRLELLKSRSDFSRWTIQHRIIKSADILAAVIVVDGAWINLKERKLATPPQQVHDVFIKMPKGDLFQWNDK